MSHTSYENTINLTSNKLKKLLKSDEKLSHEVLFEQDRSKEPTYIECREKLRVHPAPGLLLRSMYVHSFLEIGTIGPGGLPSL